MFKLGDEVKIKEEYHEYYIAEVKTQTFIIRGIVEGMADIIGTNKHALTGRISVDELHKIIKLKLRRKQIS